MGPLHCTPHTGVAVVADRLKATAPEKVGAIAGDLQDAESMKAALDLFRALSVANLDCRQDGARIGGGAREAHLFNTTFAGIDQADAILLVGANPRLEAPLLNARIRKRWLRGNFKIGVIGAVTPDLPLISSPGPNVKMIELMTGIRNSADALKAQGINKVVLVSHLGYTVEQQVAATVPGIDLIVGGHSHTLLGTFDNKDFPKSEGPYPTIVNNPDGNKTLLVAAWPDQSAVLRQRCRSAAVVFAAALVGRTPSARVSSVPASPPSAATRVSTTWAAERCPSPTAA